MSETREIDELGAGEKPSRLLPSADFVRTVRGYILPPGQDWRHAVNPEYWHNVIGRLQPGDRIEVHDDTHSVQFEVLVFGANDQGAVVRADVGFRAIWPPDLELPGPKIRDARFRDRPSGAGDWEVQDLVTGEVLSRHRTQRDARVAIAALEAATEQAAERRAEKKRHKAAA